MAAQSVGSYGQRLDLYIRQGASFGPVVVNVVDTDGAVVSLSGCTISGQIREKALSAAKLAEFVFDITDAASGQFTFSLSASDTSAIEAPEKIGAISGKYPYDIEVADSTGRIVPVFWGWAIVQREVTR